MKNTLINPYRKKNRRKRYKQKNKKRKTDLKDKEWLNIHKEDIFHVKYIKQKERMKKE